MKTFLSIILIATGLNAFGNVGIAQVHAESANSIELVNDPYKTLKTAFISSKKAPTIDEIPWATEASKTWKGCVSFFHDNNRSDEFILLFKWIKKNNNGPLVGDDQLKISLAFSTYKTDFGYNENVFDGPYESFWEIKDNTLYILYKDLDGNKIKSHHELRSDGRYIFFKQDNSDDQPSYGYCWK